MDSNAVSQLRRSIGRPRHYYAAFDGRTIGRHWSSSKFCLALAILKCGLRPQALTCAWLACTILPDKRGIRVFHLPVAVVLLEIMRAHGMNVEVQHADFEHLIHVRGYNAYDSRFSRFINSLQEIEAQPDLKSSF